MNLIDAEELKSLIREAVADALVERGSRPCHHCGLSVEQHKTDHDFLCSLIATFNRINNIKWAVVQALVIGLAIAAVTLLGIKIK